MTVGVKTKVRLGSLYAVFISIGHADFSDAFQQLQVSIEDSVYY